MVPPVSSLSSCRTSNSKDRSLNRVPCNKLLIASASLSENLLLFICLSLRKCCFDSHWDLLLTIFLHEIAIFAKFLIFLTSRLLATLLCWQSRSKFLTSESIFSIFLRIYATLCYSFSVLSLSLILFTFLFSFFFVQRYNVTLMGARHVLFTAAADRLCAAV